MNPPNGELDIDWVKSASDPQTYGLDLDWVSLIRGFDWIEIL